MTRKTFDPGRLTGLSDGVFAIAMTLLVLNLQLPDVGTLDDAASFAAGLSDQLPRFFSWLLSFAILCRLWTVHHDLLAEGGIRTRRFMMWNFVLLGAVSFIPFPTSLLSEHPDQLVSVVVFSASFVVAGIALGGMRRDRDYSLVADGTTPARGSFSRATLLILATAILSCGLALVEPRIGAALWFSYPFTGGVVRRLDQRARMEEGS